MNQNHSKIDQNRLKSIKIEKKQLKSIKMNQNRSKSIKMNQNQSLGTPGHPVCFFPTTLVDGSPFLPHDAQRRQG